MAYPPPTPRLVQVPPLHELRIELERTEVCSVKLVAGTAEIFGFELVPGFENPLAEECKAAIFTWTGCDLEILGRPSTEYVAEETPLPSHYNAHLALESMRVNCVPPPSFLPLDDPIRAQPLHMQPDETNGPRVLVVGDAGSGKSTLCKSLINWAIRAGKARRDGSWREYGTGRKVLFVNLDTSDGALTVPGTLTAVPIDNLLPTTTPVLPFGSSHSTALPPLAQPSTSTASWQPQPNLNALAPMHNALTFYYGSTEWAKNEGLTESLFSKLGDCARRRIDQSNDEGIWRGGIIVDTPADLTKKENYKWITRAVREFEINVLLVVGNERLQVEMSKLLHTNKTVTVIRVPKNSGSSGLDFQAKRRLQAAQIRSYFYGGPSVSFGALAPHSMSIPFPVLSINRVGEDAFVPLSALPIGHTRSIKDTQLVELDPMDPSSSGDIMGKLCALPQIDSSRSQLKKRKRTASPPAEVAKPVPESAAKEASVQPDQGRQATAEATVKTEDPAASSDASAVKKEEEDASTVPPGETDGQTNGSTKQEEKAEEGGPNDDDPYADYTEEEKQQLAEEAIEDSEVASSPVLGFIHVSQLDVNKHKYTILSPLPGKLPRTRLILGAVEWLDT